MAAEVKINVIFNRSGTDPQSVARDVQQIGNAANESKAGFSILAGAAATALGSIAANAVMAAGSMLTNFASSSINMAGQFEGKMNEFAAAAGGAIADAGMEVSQFQDLFLELGARLPVSTLEVQEAALALAKGGLDPAAIAAGALESSLQFASAAGMSLEGAAELSVKQLGTFVSFSASAAEKTAFMATSQDLLVKAANASTLNVENLGEAMLEAGGQAKAMGLDYEDFVTTMGLISPSFSSAATAGTSFKNFLVRTIPTTKPATEAMKELGLITAEGANVFFDAQGNFLGAANASQQLKTALEGLSAEQRVQYLQAIFGNDAMGAAVALADAGADGYDAFAEAMANANGVMEQSAATQQGMEFAAGEFEGAIEAASITIGLKLLPALTFLTEIGTSVVNALMGDTNAAKRLTEQVTQLFANIRTYAPEVLAAFAAWISSGSQWVGPLIAQVVNELGRLISSVVNWIISNPYQITAAFLSWGSAATTWINEAIVGIATGLSRLLTGVSNFLANNTGQIGSMLRIWTHHLIQWIPNALPAIATALTRLLNGVRTWALRGAPALRTIMSTWVSDLPAVFARSAPAIQAQLGILMQRMQDVIVTMSPILASAATTWFADGMNLLGRTIAGSLGVLRGAVVAAIPLVQSMFAAWIPIMAEWVVMAIPAMAQALALVLGAIRQWVLSVLPQLGESMRSLGTTFINTFTTLPSQIAPQLASFGMMLKFWVNSVVPVLQTELLLWAQTLGSWVLTGITFLGEALAMGITVIGQLIATYAPSVAAAFIAWATVAGQWVIDAIPVMMGMLSNLLAAVSGWISGALPVLLAAISSWAQFAIQWIIDAIPVLTANLSIFLGMITTWVAANAPILVANLATWGIAMWQWLMDAMPSLIANLMNLLNVIVQWIITSLPPLATQLSVWALAFASWVINEGLPPLLANLGLLLGELTGWLISVLPQIAAELRNWANTFTAWVLLEALPSLTVDLGLLFAEVLRTIGGWIEGTKADATQVGKAMVDGMIQGLRNTVANLYDQARSIASQTLDTIKAALGIQSPSTVFRDEVGLQMGLGLAEGLANSTPQVIAATEAQTDEIMNSMDSMLAMQQEYEQRYGDVGADFANAMANGMTASTPVITGAATQQAVDLVDSMQAALATQQYYETMFGGAGTAFTDNVALGISEATPTMISAITMQAQTAVEAMRLALGGTGGLPSIFQDVTIPAPPRPSWADELPSIFENITIPSPPRPSWADELPSIFESVTIPSPPRPSWVDDIPEASANVAFDEAGLSALQASLPAIATPTLPPAEGNVAAMVGQLIADQRTQNVTYAPQFATAQSGTGEASMLNALARGLR
jgi:TP901 family phage tail tape measure protein